MALQHQQSAADQQKSRSKDTPVRSLEEADRSSPGDTGHSITSVSSKRDTPAIPTLNNFRPRSTISYSEAEISGQQNVNADVDAGADTPVSFVSANSPSKPLFGPVFCRNTDIDISPQSHNQELKSSETHSTSLGLQQTLDRSVTSSSTEKDRDTHQILSNTPTSQVKASSNSSRTGAKNDIPDLRMFLIRPSVRDYGESVQVSWNTIDTKIQQSEIRKQLALYERENPPSVLDTLETLRTNERTDIESITEYGDLSTDWSRFELIALKRTWTNISHREMVFQGVPGLRIFYQRLSSQHQLVPSTKRSKRMTGSERRAPRDTWGMPSSNPFILPNDAQGWRPSSGKESSNPSPLNSIPSIRPEILPIFAPARLRRRRRPRARLPGAAAKELASIECIEKVERVPSPEVEFIDDAEGEQVVAELLGKYTTLYG